MPPSPKKDPKTLSLHGDTRIDDYYWMNQREDPAVIAHLEAENAYFTEKTAHYKEFQDRLFQEMKAKIKEDDSSVPYVFRGYEYRTEYKTGDQYPRYLRRPLDGETEEMLLNANTLAEPHDFYNVTGLTVSDDNRYLSYGEDTLSRRIYTIRIKDLHTGQNLPDVIPNTTGGSVWSADGDYLFYSVKDEALRPYKIMRHRLGTPAQEDVVVYEETDETFRAFVFRSKSRKYLIIGSAQTVSTEYRLLEADNPLGEARIFQARERDLEYSIGHLDDRFYIVTNYRAKNFQLMVTSETATEKENWQTIVPNREDVLLEDTEIFQDYLVLTERKAGLVRLRVRPFTGEEHYIDFDDPAYVAYVGTNPEFATEMLRFGYQSLTTPASTYDYNMRTREQELRKRQPVLGDFDPENYTSERVMAKSRDGLDIPLSIVYRKGTPKNGSAPLLLYGYGSYGYSIDPTFSISRLSLLDRGVLFVITHIRGGEEMGRQWYENGKLLNKKNTFYDFIDSAEWLIQQQYTSSDRLFAMGGSAGGLLVGAVANLRPDLFAGIVAAVPFVDVVTTMLDDSIPLTTGEYDEWGNPNKEQYYHYIKSYSPVDQVSAQDYPPMLVTTGFHDSQVQYWEPAKWVAKLRDNKTDDNDILFHTNLEAGHGGASGRFERLKEVARDYAWVLDQAGLIK